MSVHKASISGKEPKARVSNGVVGSSQRTFPVYTGAGGTESKLQLDFRNAWSRAAPILLPFKGNLYCLVSVS